MSVSLEVKSALIREQSLTTMAAYGPSSLSEGEPTGYLMSARLEHESSLRDGRRAHSKASDFSQKKPAAGP
jgi:hypothetical protein